MTHTSPNPERFELDLFVDTGSWEGFFDRLEIWRSRGTELGPYEPLHDDADMPARLPPNMLDALPTGTSGRLAVLSGKKLQFTLDGETIIDITFSGTDPLTYAAAATQIENQSLGRLTAFVSDKSLIVQTALRGAKVDLQCTGGNAAPLLGLSTTGSDSLAFGRDARIVLQQDTEEYTFIDPHGSREYFYKSRFFDTTTRSVSAFSDPFQGDVFSGLSLDSLCRVYVNLVGMTGEPACRQEVLLYNEFNGYQREGKTVVGGPLRLLTDDAGHAEALIARGSRITVAIGGTPLARDILVPTDTSIESLNLLSSANGRNDVFTVQVPNLNYAVRRSL